MASKLKLLQEQIGKQQATIEKKVSQILHLPIAFATDLSVKKVPTTIKPDVCNRLLA